MFMHFQYSYPCIFRPYYWHDLISSLREEIWAHKSSLVPPFILNDLCQARKVNDLVLVLCVMILPLSTICFIGLWNSSNSVVLFPHFITISLKYAITLLCYLLLYSSIKFAICVQLQICRAMK